MRGNPRYSQRLGNGQPAQQAFAGEFVEKVGTRGKKRNERGGGEEKQSFFPPAPPSFIFFCSPSNFRAIVSFSKGVFEEQTTGSEAISLLICLDTTKFILPSFFTLTEAICRKFQKKRHCSRTQNSKLPVDMRHSKTFKLLDNLIRNDCYSCTQATLLGRTLEDCNGLLFAFG